MCETPDDIYIVEFKLDRPAAEAMAQIKGKDYAGKYALSKKRITLIGVSFSSEKRTIVEDQVEVVSAICGVRDCRIDECVGGQELCENHD